MQTNKSQLGLILRDNALEKSSQGRKEAIRLVREWLERDARLKSSSVITYVPLDGSPAFESPTPPLTLTGDDVLDAVEALGLGEGDRRWTASVLVGWSAVKPTERYVISRRPSCNGRPKKVWRWV